MAGQLPTPITVTDELLVAVVDRLDRLIDTIAQAQPIAPPLPDGVVELRERQRPRSLRGDPKGRR